jgi:hypothetical protein
MTQLVLEVPKDKDLQLLLALCQRLEIRVVETTFSPESKSKLEEVRRVIEAGVPDRSDFGTFLQEFENNRKDRKCQ